ncbi:MAG: ATP-binding cassette domain-containing protein, partial [Bacteroidota bacterium]
MLVLNNITFEFGSRALYREASWHIKPNEKIGLIGANGTGKSTLLRIINGEYQLSAGDVSGRRDLSIGFLNQGAGEVRNMTAKMWMMTAVTTIAIIVI